MTPVLAWSSAAVLALVGWRIGWLTPHGAAAAVLVGGTVFWRAGIPGAALLALFFASSSALTGVGRARQNSTETARNARQVLANGGCAAVGAFLVPVAPQFGWPILAGALNAAMADTWATEVGTAFSTQARLITNGRPVPAGTSGGVSLVGTSGGLCGAVLFATLTLVVGSSWPLMTGSLLGGTSGLLVDSLLGATVQARFYCEHCNTLSERGRHHCGEAGRYAGGWAWLDNDGVNFFATAVGAAVAVAWSQLW